MHRTPFWWTRDEMTRLTERHCQPLGLCIVGGRWMKFEYWKLMEWHWWEILGIRQNIYHSTGATIIKLHTDGRHSRWEASLISGKNGMNPEVGQFRGWNFSGAINLCCITDQLVKPIRARRCLHVPPSIHQVPLQFEHTVCVFFSQILATV